MHLVGRLLRLTRCSEYGLGVVPHDLKPRGDIGGMIGAWMVGDTQVSQYEPAKNFHAAFFRGIGSRAEPP
jgi:hypothetical protein